MFSSPYFVETYVKARQESLLAEASSSRRAAAAGKPSDAGLRSTSARETGDAR